MTSASWGLRGEGPGVQFCRVKTVDIGKFGQGVQCRRVTVGEIGSCRAWAGRVGAVQ